MVSRRGFTQKALNVAKHENIGCLSLLPHDPRQVGFRIGDWWYGVIRLWTNIRILVDFDLPEAPVPTFDVSTAKWGGKPLVNWYMKELFTTYQNIETEGPHTLTVVFDQTRLIEIEGKEYPVKRIFFVADRIFKKKRMFVSWSGDAFFDWQTCQMSIPPRGVVMSSLIESDPTAWPDYDGAIPGLEQIAEPGFLQGISRKQQNWDASKDADVPDLASL